MVVGEAQLRSPLFSNRWRLIQNDNVTCELHRLGKIYTTTANLGGAGRLVMEPAGQGTVHAVDEEGKEIARIVRRSWLGRRWEISGLGYTYELVSDPRPRRWHIEVANAPVAHIEGSMFSYNRVNINSALAVPVPAILLAWHVVTRPWEAVAEPSGLRPLPAQQAST